MLTSLVKYPKERKKEKKKLEDLGTSISFSKSVSADAFVGLDFLTLPLPMLVTILIFFQHTSIKKRYVGLITELILTTSTVTNNIRAQMLVAQYLNWSYV